MVLLKFPQHGTLNGQWENAWVSPGTCCSLQIDSFCSSLKIYILHLAFCLFSYFEILLPPVLCPSRSTDLAAAACLPSSSEPLHCPLPRWPSTAGSPRERQRCTAKEAKSLGSLSALLPSPTPTMSVYGYFSSILLPPPSPTRRMSCLDELQPTWPPK